jgi:hypothetical protein
MPLDLADSASESARMAWERAPTTCATGWRGDESCAWYHGFWPTLRVLGLAATPEREAAFFGDAFGECARTGEHDRVVVTGAADQGQLAHVLSAWARAGRDPELTVLDQCGTPLRLCEWFAGRNNRSVRTIVTDVLRWEPDRAWDVATSHAFVGMLPHAEKAALVARWAAALRPGGRVITNARIDPAWDAACPGFSAEQVEQFVAVVREHAEASGDEGIPATDALAAAARRYGQRMLSFPFASADEVRDLFERGGFRMLRFDVVEMTGRDASRRSGPGTNRGGTFAQLVAERL